MSHYLLRNGPPGYTLDQKLHHYMKLGRTALL